MENPCNVCKWRWAAMQPAGEGHCYMFRDEPHPCAKGVFSLDERAFARDIFRQLLNNARGFPDNG